MAAEQVASRVVEADKVGDEALVTARFAQIIPKCSKPTISTKSTTMTLKYSMIRKGKLFGRR